MVEKARQIFGGTKGSLRRIYDSEHSGYRSMVYPETAKEDEEHKI